MIHRKINQIFLTFLIFLNINTSFICGHDSANLIMRNNINGDFNEVEDISNVQPGAFINLNWKNKNLMLPLSPRKGFLSFSDKKWDWRYSYNDQGIINESEPVLYELLQRGEFIDHKCTLNKK